jgi:hypothetical protein
MSCAAVVMNTPASEQFLAKIYVEPVARARFLAAPRAEAARVGLSEGQYVALENIDQLSLELAARSFAPKRASKRPTSISIGSRWWRACKTLRFKVSAVFRDTSTKL